MATPCKSCGKSLRWVRSVNGKMMPIEAEANPDGRVWLDVMQVAHVVGPLGTFPDGTRHRYVAHFATCPQGPAHRRAKDSGSAAGNLPGSVADLSAADRPASETSVPVQGDLFGKGKP